MHRIKYYIIIILLVLLALSISGCLKEQIIDTSLVKETTFFKQQSLSQYDKNYAISNLSNGGYLAVGSAGESSFYRDLIITYLDQYGKIKNDANLSLGNGSLPFITRSSNNDLILNDLGFPAISKFNDNGVRMYRELLTKRGMPTTVVGLYKYSKVTIGRDDNYYMALYHIYDRNEAIAGNGLYGVIHIDANTGLETKFDSLDIQDFGGIPVSIAILEVKNNEQWITAQVSAGNPVLSSEYDKQKIVVSKLSDGKMTKSIDLTLKDTIRGESLQCNNVLSNGDFILVGGESSVDFSNNNNNSRKSISVYTVTNDLDEAWNKTINLEATSIVSRQVKENNNGEILIFGTCKPDNLSYNSGFILKLSSNGDLLMQHFFDLGQSADFEDFIQLPDKSFIFVGGVNNFGNGIESMNSFTLKTDENFNF